MTKRIKIHLLILLLSASFKLTAQYGYYYNNELSVGLEINSFSYFMQIFKPEIFQHDKQFIDSLLYRDQSQKNKTSSTDIIIVPVEGTFLTGLIGIENDMIVLKDFKGNSTIATFIVIDSLTIKLDFSSIRTLNRVRDPVYFYKTVSYFKPESQDFYPPKVYWKYSNFDETSDNTDRDTNWYFFDRDQKLIKVIPDTGLVHPLVSQADNNTVYSDPEQYPKFKGDIKDFIEKELKYPDSAYRKNIEGTVYVGFRIDTLGNTKNHKILKGVCTVLDAEAMRIARLLKFEKPAMNRGEPVEMEYTVPIRFKIQKGKY